MYKKNNSKEQNGLTAIEAIFAILIIVIGLVVYTSSLNLVKGVRSAKYQDIAYHIASKQIEDLRNTDFASLPASQATADPRLELLLNGSGFVTITDINSDLKQVNVNVTWIELGNTKSVNLDTLIYVSGINGL
ncbi:MAG: hypothetical protein A2826_02215 [Candidatus Doudnabacteria bacterium RIFCSPHIGHO2_01_FULL_43_23]|uniref:Prepilin-type N-terminal cleavage/methylation domain-containing protein n=1 Tax=Candidatus Doudnabacteria bacterium RIFCSPHIGHO2_01_FULL_43_23 TaxID=1817822 RepID=A0A1F5NUL9_9BACT|nr:MAG: hypothetical protein A2826_02215 [Candidatus Doudnabacteria bacterium RIFCSPHIGHO2_01_FULL_43_23]